MPAEQWLSAFVDGKKVGYVHETVRETAGGGFAAVSSSMLKLKEGERIMKMSTSCESLFGPGPTLESFDFRMAVDGGSLEAAGRWTAGGFEVGFLPPGGRRTTSLLPAEGDPLVPSSVLGAFVARRGLSAGDTYRVRVILESLATVAPMGVEVGKPEEIPARGGKVGAYPVRISSDASSLGISWMGADGTVYREVGPQGVELLQAVGEAEAASLEEDTLVSYSTLLASTMVRPDRPLPGGGDVETLSLRVEGLPPGYELPQGEFQEVGERETYRDSEGDERMRALVRITRPSPPPGDSGGEDGEGRGNLGDTPFLPVSDARIAKLSSDLTAGAEGNRAKAEAILAWVRRNIRGSMAESFSALQVLERGEGECQAHAMLMAALCRAAGVPARVVGGLVWSDGDGAFLYHAWVEVRVAGRWYPMDPTLGEERPSPARLKLLDDALGGQWRLMGVVKRITLRLEEESRP